MYNLCEQFYIYQMFYLRVIDIFSIRTKMDWLRQDVLVTVESLMEQLDQTVLVSILMVQMVQGILLAKEMVGMRSQQLQLN